MKKGFFFLNIGNLINRVVTFLRTSLKLFIMGDATLGVLFSLADRTIALFRRIATDGSFQSLFQYYYNLEKAKNQEKPFAREVLKFMIMKLSILVLGFIISIPLVSKLFLFNSQGEYWLFSWFLLCLSPVILFMFLISFFSSLLNINNLFEYSATAPIIGNISFTLLLYLNYMNYISIGNFWGLVLGSWIYSGVQIIFMAYFARDFIKNKKNTSEDYELSSDFSKDTFSSIGFTFLSPLSELIVGIMASSSIHNNFVHMEYSYKYVFFLLSILGIPIINTASTKISKLFQNNQENFKSFNTKLFLLIHLISIPVVIFLYFYGEYLMEKIICKASNLQDKNSMLKTFFIISSTFYWSMIIRLFNTFNNASKQVYNTLSGNVLIGISYLSLSIIFQNIPFGFAWASNIAHLLQCLFLVCKGYQSNIFTLDFDFIFSFITSSLFSFILIYEISFYELSFWFLIPAGIIYVWGFSNYFQLLMDE